MARISCFLFVCSTQIVSLGLIFCLISVKNHRVLKNCSCLMFMNWHIVFQVVMAVGKLYYYVAPSNEVGVVVRALIRLLRSHRLEKHTFYLAKSIHQYNTWQASKTVFCMLWDLFDLLLLDLGIIFLDFQRICVFELLLPRTTVPSAWKRLRGVTFERSLTLSHPSIIEMGGSFYAIYLYHYEVLQYFCW